MKKRVIIITMLFMIAAEVGFSGGQSEQYSDRKGVEPVVTNPETEESPKKLEETSMSTMNLHIGDRILTANLVDNSTTEALKRMLSEGPISIDMRDYGNMEKVGGFGRNLPRNDEPITTEAGDLILYQGNAFVIYYESNSWNFSRIGKIIGVSKSELKEILGSGDVTVTLSL